MQKRLNEGKVKANNQKNSEDKIISLYTDLFVRINTVTSVNSLPIRTLFSRSTSFKWENIRSTDTCVQGKQLMIRDTGCTIRGYLEIMSHTFGSFNLPSRSTSTSASANTVRSHFADGVADASVAAVVCKELKYASRSDTDAGDSDAASLPLESVSASARALSLEVL